jgi:hypothetical protein
MKPAHRSTTGRKRKDVRDILLIPQENLLCAMTPYFVNIFSQAVK